MVVPTTDTWMAADWIEGCSDGAHPWTGWVLSSGGLGRAGRACGKDWEGCWEIVRGWR